MEWGDGWGMCAVYDSGHGGKTIKKKDPGIDGECETRIERCPGDFWKDQPCGHPNRRLMRPLFSPVDTSQLGLGEVEVGQRQTMASCVSVKMDQQYLWTSSMTKEFGINPGSSSETSPQSLTSRRSERVITSTGDVSCETVRQQIENGKIGGQTFWVLKSFKVFSSNVYQRRLQVTVPAVWTDIHPES